MFRSAVFAMVLLGGFSPVPASAVDCLDYDARFHWLDKVNTGGDATDVYYADGYCYTTVYSQLPNPLWQNGLHVIDPDTPDGPRIVGHIGLAGGAFHVVVQNKVAYVVSTEAGLHVVDVSDPAAPALVDSVVTSAPTYDVALSGDVVALAARTEVVICNISDPMSPQVVGVFPIPSVQITPDLAISGHHVFVALRGTPQGLLSLDISDPASPQVSDMLELFSTPRSVEVRGNHAFIAAVDGLIEGLIVVDISDPHNIDVASTCDEIYGIQDLTVAGDYVYLAVAYYGLAVVDIKDVLQPTLAARYRLPGALRGCAIHDDKLYVADSRYNSIRTGFHVFQIVSFEENVPIATVNYQYGITQADAEGDLLYYVNSYLRILDISDPADIRIAAEFDDLGDLEFVSVAQDIVGLGTATHEVNLYDFVDVSHPAFLSSLEIPDIIYAMELTPDYLYVVVRNAGLIVYTLRDPTDPQQVAVMPLEGGTSVDVQGGLIYVVEAGGIRVLEMASPTQLLEISFIPTAQRAYSIASRPGELCIVEYDNQGYIYDMSSPQTPAIAARFRTPNIPTHVTFDDENIYLSNQRSGLTIFTRDSLGGVRAAGSISTQSNYTYNELSLLHNEYLLVFDSYEGLTIRTFLPPCHDSTPVLLSGLEIRSIGAETVLTWRMEEPVGVERVRVRADCGMVYVVPVATGDGIAFTAVDRARRCPQAESITYTIELQDEDGNWTVVARQMFTPPRSTLTASITRAEPNPFNPRIQVSYVVGAEHRVVLGVYDLRGRLVKSLVQGAIEVGEHAVAWDGCDADGAPMPAGTYLIHLETEGRVDTRKVSLVR